jgi:hypothetical protein
LHDNQYGDQGGAYPVSRQTAASIGSHRGAGIGIVAGRSTIEPGFEIAQRMRRAPFLQHCPCHRSVIDLALAIKVNLSVMHSAQEQVQILELLTYFSRCFDCT